MGRVGTCRRGRSVGSSGRRERQKGRGRERVREDHRGGRLVLETDWRGVV